MTHTTRKHVLFAALACLTCIAPSSWAQEAPEPQQAPQAQPAPEAPIEAPSVEAPLEPNLEVEAAQAEAEQAEAAADEHFERPHRNYGNAIVRFGSDAHLRANETADAVVSIFGSSTNEGEVYEGVVSIFGNTRVTGRTGDAAVAIFGDTYVNNTVHGDAVAVFGNLELGPEARIHGEAVAVGGSILRDPGAAIHGGMQEVGFAGEFGQLRWLRPWVEHCLLLGRPLAMEPGLDWAWWLAFGFLGLYVLIALLFGGSVERCVRTLETKPGESTIAALVSVFLAPVFLILLSVTVIGLIFVPFFGLALFIASLFGKAVVLAALGRRVTRFADEGPLTHIAVSVIIGGILVTGIYLVPVLGFIAYKVIGILGLGVVVYTLIGISRERRAALAPPAPPAPPSTTSVAAPASDFRAGGDASGAAAEPPPDAGAAQAGAAAIATPLTALPRAEFWIRIAALIIDAVLIAIIVKLLPGSGDVWLLALAAYGALMWKLKGTTVGGIICNLRVVRMDGREVDWPTAIVRALGCFLSLFAVGLGFIWIAIDPERQGWHDKIAGTIVVRTPKGGSLV